MLDFYNAWKKSFITRFYILICRSQKQQLTPYPFIILFYFFHEMKSKVSLNKRYNVCFHNSLNKKVMIFLQKHVENSCALFVLKSSLVLGAGSNNERFYLKYLWPSGLSPQWDMLF